jgi:hypothetical protein
MTIEVIETSRGFAISAPIRRLVRSRGYTDLLVASLGAIGRAESSFPAAMDGTDNRRMRKAELDGAVWLRRP